MHEDVCVYTILSVFYVLIKSDSYIATCVQVFLTIVTNSSMQFLHYAGFRYNEALRASVMDQANKNCDIYASYSHRKSGWVENSSTCLKQHC